MPNANELITFAHNSRTLCIAFVALASRFYYKNIDNHGIQATFNAARSEIAAEQHYDICANLEGVEYILPPAVFAKRDVYESVLDQLFNTIIIFGNASYSHASENDPTLTATNYLKRDKNYYAILKANWTIFHERIHQIFSSLDN